MAPSWREVQQASEEKRCELVLSGAEISKRISEEGLDVNIFQVKHLNFLEISKTCLSKVPRELGELINLTRVIFRHNELKSVPNTIVNLKKLKFLDFSFNSITELPEGISTLTDLQSINVCNNKISSLPELHQLVKLVSLNIAHNEFEEFPANVCNSALIHFSELVANNNKMTSIPADIKQLGGLKIFNLGENVITAVPGELGDCTKIKELNLKDNKLKDKRLVKLIEQCHIKQIMEYIRSHCPKTNADDSKQTKSKKQAKQSKKTPANEEIVQLLDQLTVLHVQDDIVKVTTMPEVQNVRPYVVCCVVQNVDFHKEQQLMKKFITLQTKLHENVCEKRTLATIATHDVAKINGNLKYDAKEPKQIKIVPLNRKTEVNAAKLYAQLNEEADALRKEKKKNTFSGIHKYLYLLKDKSVYPCLSDDSGQVISFPPITNSEGTKVSEETTSILLEVTGNALSTCKKVMDTLLEEIVKLDLGKPPLEDSGDEEESSSKRSYLTVQQVKIVDEEGVLKVVYPSRTDLQSDSINVIRL